MSESYDKSEHKETDNSDYKHIKDASYDLDDSVDTQKEMLQKR